MGVAKSYERIEYRKKIMNALCTNEEIIKLLGESDSRYPEDTIPFHKSFPHEYIPGTITRTERFINFDFRTDLDSKNRVLKNITIWFWVVCHENVVRYFEDGRDYLWYDKAVCALDEIFTGEDILGIGKTWLVSTAPYYPQQEFKGVLLTFKVYDFYNGEKYGK